MTRFLFSSRYTAVLALFWLALVSPRSVQAQSSLLQQGAPTARQNGWNLFGGSYSFGYFTFNVPPSSPNGPLRTESDYDSTASVSAGYTHVSPRTSFGLVYTPTLTRRVRYSNLRAFNQSVSVSLTRALSQRWELGVSGSVRDSTYDQLAFVPDVPSISLTAAQPDSLLESAQTAQATSSQVQTSLLQNPNVLVPSRSVLFGTRYLNSVISAGATYRQSTRLHIGFHASASRSEIRDGLQDSLPSPSSQPLPKFITQQAGMELTYSLTPRTAVGAQSETSHVDSTVGRYYVQVAQGSLHHRPTPHWFISFQGGPAYVFRTLDAGFSTPVAPHGARPSYSIQTSARYMRRQHSLTGSYSVAPTDLAGFGSQRSRIAATEWEWQPISHPWAFSVNAGHQSMVGGILGDVQYWQGRASATRFLSTQFAIMFAYAYIGRPAVVSSVVGASQDLSGFSGRIMLLWTPQRREQRQPAGEESSAAEQPATTRRIGQ